MFKLDNKTAIISGGSKGIGKAIALKYAEAAENRDMKESVKITEIKEI